MGRRMRDNVLNALDFIIQDLKSKTDEERFDFFMEKSPRFKAEITKAEEVLDKESTEFDFASLGSYSIEITVSAFVMNNVKPEVFDAKRRQCVEAVFTSNVELKDELWPSAA